jgi:DNA mismatch endonuclease, patch repair protein
MSSVRSSGSTAELAIRRRLWDNGVRYRIKSNLIGKPDLVFPGSHVVVFIDGDLWHGNSWKVRGLPSLESQFPTNTAWWVDKIRRNIERDKLVTATLTEQGWRVLRYWESSILKDPDLTTLEIATAVRGERPIAFRTTPLSGVERRRLGSAGLRRSAVSAVNSD